MYKMNSKQIILSSSIISGLIKKHRSLREFARVINEDAADLIRWRDGKSKVKASVVVKLCKMFNEDAHDLRPDIFPEGCKITFSKE